MTRERTDKFEGIRRTAVRGLKPSKVFLIAAAIMVSGFAVSTIETVADEPDESEVVVVERMALRNTMSPAEERATLLADENALHRATMWLARCVYSESYKRHEQELVAWVVRNRVETRYRGKSTYRSVITDPYQFSAFNDQSITRDFLISIDSTYTEKAWLQAVEVAEKVIMADPRNRPFPRTVRHFYSEQSLGEGLAPEWALEYEPVDLQHLEIEEKRFRFFKDIS